jgi:hypothetical protein
MIFKIHTLYLFLAFAISALLFMQNPIIYELKFHDTSASYMEFSQIWRSVILEKETSIPSIRNEVMHVLCMSVIMLGSLLAIVFTYKMRVQLVVFFATVLATFCLVISLFLEYHFRLMTLDTNLEDAVLSPHILWFLMLLMFQFFAFTSLYEGYKIKFRR